MDVNNRIADVIKLRSNICQKFLHLKLDNNVQWKSVVYEKVRIKIENKTPYYTSNYSCLYEKIRDIGIDDYSIEDMDVSLISHLIEDFNGLLKVENQTKKAFKQLVDDRNLTNHSSGNEEEEEQYLIGLLSLIRLKEFVRIVDKYELSINDNKRLLFRQRNIKRIDSLKEILDNERIELIYIDKEIDRDIQVLIDDKDKNTWLRINGTYFKRITEEEGRNRYQKFIIKASDAGIPAAHIYALSLFEDNWNELEKRIQMIFESDEQFGSYEAHCIVESINIYIIRNGINNRIPVIVAKIEEYGYKLGQDETGYYTIEG
ncbi:MAG: hypothetical protein E7570_09515 [Ruminococcaceae bacterium]|nr:hypothetical protein [Oscillospiraceae bacterium]